MLALKLTPRKKIEHKFIHISLKRDVSRELKHSHTRFENSYEVWHKISWELLRIVENLLAGSLREMNSNELF